MGRCGAKGTEFNYARQMSCGDLMYSWVTIVSNTIIHSKSARRLDPQSSHHTHKGSHVGWWIVWTRLTVVINSRRACISTHQVVHLKDLQFPLINHTPVKPINHTPIKMRDHKMKRKAVRLQCSLIKNNNGKKRRKNKTDKDPNLMELIFYLDKTGGEKINQGLQTSDACRRRREKA